MAVECTTCGGDDIAENNFCDDCGSVVCHVCGNTGSSEWDDPHEDNGEWVSYCQGCGEVLRTDHNPF